MTSSDGRNTDGSNIDELSFEQALEELEEIVAALEAGQVPLDETLAGFERAMRLKERGASLLQSAEARISKLLDEQGNTEPLATEASGEDAEAGEGDNEQ